MNFQSSNFRVLNTDLASYHWEATNPKAVVVLVHGMGEHALRYETSVVKHLLVNGFSVVAYDNFGHGQTKGKRGDCPSYEALMQSVEGAINQANELYPNTPKFLYGHSMGGNLVLNYALKHDHQLQGVIATSPFLRLAFQPPTWKMSLGKLLLNIWPSLTLPSELEVEAISRDSKEVKRYSDDALVHDKVSPRFSFPIIDAGEWAIANANTLKTPALILHGTGDRIIDHKASQAFAEASEASELKLFEGGYHELHHDVCKEAFMTTLLDWLDRKSE